MCFRLARAVLHSLHLLLRHSQATILAWAKAYLRAVHIEMNVESTKEMMENIKCYDDLSFGAGRFVDVKAFARGKGDPPGTGIRAVAVLSAPVITPQWMWVHCRIFCALFGPALSSIPVRNLRCPSGSSKYYGFCCCSEAPPSFEVSLRNLGCRRARFRPSLP